MWDGKVLGLLVVGDAAGARVARNFNLDVVRSREMFDFPTAIHVFLGIRAPNLTSQHITKKNERMLRTNRVRRTYGMYSIYTSV